MYKNFKMTDIQKAQTDERVRDFLSMEACANVSSYHKSYPQYTSTPLVELKETAAHFGLKNVFVKDESYRFGLNAFKVLGASYAMGVYLAEKLGLPLEKLSYEALTSQEAKEKLGDMTFITTTDGNHGRGLAWTAQQLGYKSIVKMPKGSAQERLDNIRACGSDAEITDMNYDDAVRHCNELAQKHGYVMVQDTAWEGYTQIPKDIMRGYATMAFEAIEQLGDTVPTHVFLQAGVGSMAGAVAGLLANHYGDKKPMIVIVEPNKADCIYRTAEAKDGKLHFVTGDMDTIMAGLACGEPNQIGWDVLTETAEYAVSAPDWVAARGMRVLGNPVGQDRKIISGESGAATFGFVSTVMEREELKELREQLKLDENSVVLCFSTEGDTDRKNYLDTVWDGKDSSYNG
ncbi:MAG: diaminopropionate ammonia-lyase [Eubacteriales bacterium]|nr:diaminopropionate ammonia-lyase [Eubacteriales bacterium]